METSSELAVCLICFEVIEKHIFVGTDAAAKILKNCNTYLHSTLTKETLKGVQLKNENQMPFCKSCFDSAWGLTQLNEQRNTVEKEISDLTVTFSFEVCHRRSQVCNSQTQNNSQNGKKTFIKELNVSGLPANTFLSKEGCQNMQQLNEHKSNRSVIIDYQPDANIEIINVKFESCDLQLEDLPEDSQQATSSVDAGISFSNESQDYNQPGLENTNTVALQQREVQTTGENMSVDSTNSKDERQGINIVDLKVNAHSTSQQKSEPRRGILNKINYEDNELSNSNSVGEKRLKCFYCKKTFNCVDDRNVHQRTHTAEQPYECSFCTNRFAQHGSLVCHERTHTGEKPYKCSFCSKGFTSNSHRTRHERSHTGEKPHECSFCKNRFARIENLKDHERTHTGEKPYECSFCKMRFNSFRNKKRHEQTHTGEKPHECSFCKKKIYTIS